MSFHLYWEMRFISDSWCVYIHTNKINNKKYIGITSQLPETRWRNGRGYEPYLRFGKAIHKYGWDNFAHEVVYHNLSENEAKEAEIALIQQLNTTNQSYGYNMTTGGDGTSGYHHREDSKKKMSVAKIGENHPNYGNHLSDSTRKKIGAALTGNSNPLGVIRSDSTKEKMSESKRKPVCMMDGKDTIRIFDSAKQAQNETGISRKNISLCCLGQRKHAGGYSWSFA